MPEASSIEEKVGILGSGALAAFIGGMPLWIIIPVLLLIAGASIWFVIQIAPFIVAGTVTVIFYLIFSRFSGFNELQASLGAVTMGFVSLFLPFLSSTFQSAIASQMVSAGGYTTINALGATSEATAQLGLQNLISNLFSAPLWITSAIVFTIIILILSSLSQLGSIGAAVTGIAGIVIAALFITTGFGSVSPLSTTGVGDAVITNIEVSQQWKYEEPPGYLNAKSFLVWDARTLDQGHTEHKGVLSQASLKNLSEQKSESDGMVTYSAEAVRILKFRLYEFEEGLRDPNLDSIGVNMSWNPYGQYWSLKDVELDTGFFGGETDWNWSLTKFGGSFKVNGTGDGEHEDETISIQVTSEATATVPEGSENPIRLPAGDGSFGGSNMMWLLGGFVLVPVGIVWYAERERGPLMKVK